MKHAEVSAYDLPDGSRIERCNQRNGSHKWAVRKFGWCLNRSGNAEDEPMPSGRDDAFLARCRFDSAEDAYEAWDRAQPSNAGHEGRQKA